MTDYVLYIIAAAVTLWLGGMVWWAIRWHERKVDEAYQRGHKEGYEKGRRDADYAFLRSTMTPVINTVPVEVVKAQTYFERWEVANMGEAEFVQYAGKILRSKLMDGVGPYVKIIHWDEPRDDRVLVEARLRIARDG